MPGTNRHLIPACDRCHDAIHRGMLHVAGNADDPDGLSFTDHDGNPIEATPKPLERYRHPLGEHMGTEDVWVNPSRIAG